MANGEGEMRLFSGMAVLRLEAYSEVAGESAITARVPIYVKGRRADEFFDACRRLFAAMAFELVAYDGVESHGSADGDQKRNDPGQPSVELALRTGLAAPGDIALEGEERPGRCASPVHESAFINALVDPDRRNRFSLLLPQFGVKNSGRSKLLNQLAHLNFSTDSPTHKWTDVSALTGGEIADILRRCGAQNLGYVLSENPRWDARYWDLDTILNNCQGSGYFVVISCVAGKLFFMESEERNSRSIVEVT